MVTWTKLAVVGLVVISLLVIWQTHQIWSAAFLGVLFALSLNGPTQWQRPYLHLPHWLATSLVLLVVLMTLVGLGWVIGAPLSGQFDDLSKKLPAAAQNVSGWLEQRAWGQRILQQAEEWSSLSQPQDESSDTRQGKPATVPNDLTGGQLPTDSQTDEADAPAIEELPKEALSSIPHFAELLGHVASTLSVTVTTVTLLLLSLVVMIFVAYDPYVYQRGVLWVVPKQHEATARQTMDRLCVAMRWWMVGRLASMTAVGGLTTLGLWIIGMPVPLALGTIAGLLSFVPNIGPILSALPGLLLASGHSPSMVLWALGVYLIAQFVESNAITPMVEQYAISLPPGIVIVTQFVFVALGGVWGIIISTPLLVVVMVLIQQLYVNQTLNKHIEVTGSK